METTLLIQTEPTYRNALLEVLQAENIEKYNETWTSKYNSYVVYHNEPFCTLGFLYELKIEGQEERIKYIDHLLKIRVSKIMYLEKCLAKEYIGERK